MASLRKMNTALELKHPRYSCRVQSKSEPNNWEQESCQGDDNNHDAGNQAVAGTAARGAPANRGQSHRRVSAPPTQPGSNIPRRKPPKATHTQVLRDVPSVPDLGDENQIQPVVDAKCDKTANKDHVGTDENRPPISDGGFRGRGRRGRGFFRSRRGRGLRASPSAKDGGIDKA
ncbi:hypothetical protein VHEMI03131 [[Torrubiella] hemipterigena]|uniref:Uncharacterized protein n=1 Tax=[Torrubiella] hemipterigena TaxID=1531966 RepID=A0A0A1SRM3_9HYPO|nr:hypothetical protein VHEMI03131 [[Torrubiella] hemipterigena]